MKVLVTGGAGYIGCVLVPALLEEGYEVRVLDNLMYGGNGLLACFRNPRFDFMFGDVRNKSNVKDAIKNCDAVIHLAAVVGLAACNKYPEMATSVNVGGSKILGQCVGKNRLILFGSTGSNYGAILNKICTEETPLNPMSLYAKTKTIAEKYLLENCNTTAYRFATGFGLSSRMRLDLLINDFVHKAIRDRYLVVYEPNFKRTFIHVYDMARSFLFAIKNADRMKKTVFNVGSEEMNFTKAQVCEIIKNKIDFYLHFASVGKDIDKRNYEVSYQKIGNLGFQTTISLENGIEELTKGLSIISMPNSYSNG